MIRYPKSEILLDEYNRSSYHSEAITHLVNETEFNQDKIDFFFYLL